MTIDAQITNAIAKGKEIAISWASDFILKSNHGEDIGCQENKLILLTNWVDILEDYQLENFLDGTIIEPDVECLTLDQVQLVMSKINSLSCS